MKDNNKKGVREFIWRLEEYSLDNLENEIDEKLLSDVERDLYEEVVNDLYNIFDRLKENN